MCVLLSGGSFSRTLTIHRDNERIVTDRNAYGLRVTPGLFSTLGATLVAGREFDERDLKIGVRLALGARLVRFRYFAIQPDTFLWRADATFDGGATWTRDYWTMQVHRISR